jgi:hypothetical protein
MTDVNHMAVESRDVLADGLEFVVLAEVPDQDLAVVVDACGVVLDLDDVGAKGE